MSQQTHSEKGFSLIELIGVLAIIAILGALVAPRIFTAINDAKVTSVVQDAQRLRTVVAQFYKDTGTFPLHDDNDATTTSHQLMNNVANKAGWRGPYIEEVLASPFPTSTNYFLALAAPFDVDGDGTTDFTNTSYLYIDGLTYNDAKAISDAIDNDAAKTGSAAWYIGGKVKTYNDVEPALTNTNVILFIMVAGQ